MHCPSWSPPAMKRRRPSLLSDKLCSGTCCGSSTLAIGWRCGRDIATTWPLLRTITKQVAPNSIMQIQQTYCYAFYHVLPEHTFCLHNFRPNDFFVLCLAFNCMHVCMEETNVVTHQHCWDGGFRSDDQKMWICLLLIIPFRTCIALRLRYLPWFFSNLRGHRWRVIIPAISSLCRFWEFPGRFP